MKYFVSCNFSPAFSSYFFYFPHGSAGAGAIHFLFKSSTGLHVFVFNWRIFNKLGVKYAPIFYATLDCLRLYDEKKFQRFT